MNKGKITGIIIAAIIIVGGIGGSIAYAETSHSSTNDSLLIAQGTKNINKDNFTGALQDFSAAVTKNPKDTNAQTLKEITEKYIDADSQYKSLDFKGALQTINSITANYVSTPLKTDIDTLRINIMKKLKSSTENSPKKPTADTTKVQKQEVKSSNNTTTEAVTKNDSSNAEASNNQNSSNEGSSSVLTKQYQNLIFTLNDIGANNSNNIQQSQSGSEYDMTQAEENAYNAWNNELNQIYQLIKANISEQQANELEQNEVAWIQTKNPAVAQATQVSGSDYNQIKYSTLASMTKKRCYYLVETYCTPKNQ